MAYESLPKRDRAAKHLDVARWAESTMADRQDEMVELLAAHYLAALRYEEEFASADSERLRDLRTKTYAYARRAAARADGVANKESAARWYGVAVEQARALDLPALERAELAMDYSDGRRRATSRTRRSDASSRRRCSSSPAAEATSLSEARGSRPRIRVELAFFRYVANDLRARGRSSTEGLVAARGRSADVGARGAPGAARLDVLACGAARGGAGHPAPRHRGRPGLRRGRHGADGAPRPRHRAGMLGDPKESRRP